jgi:DNA modification methylase
VSFRIIPGDCLEVLKTLESESVHCCVTSPPYWGLRDYGVEGQIGLEATPELFVSKMVEVFREVKRVLRDDGTLWLNLGDSYNSNTHWSGGGPNAVAGNALRINSGETRGLIDGLKTKDLCGIPWLVAFALRADGWYLRSDIIWHKPNPMPESVTDRPTKSHEYIFLLTKSPRYYFDAEAIKEESLTAGDNRAERTDNTQVYGRNGDDSRKRTGLPTQAYRNKRSVWTVATAPFSDWVQTSRRVRVELDAATDDSERITSPDCPLHGDSSASASNASCDGRVADQSSRTQRSDGRHVLEPQGGLFPTDQPDASETADGSSDCSGRQCSTLAKSHNNQTHKTGHALATTAPCTSSVQTQSRTEYTSDAREHFDSADHICGNSNGADCGEGDRDSSPSGQTHCHIEGICTCEYYNTTTEKISHFATFPPKLIEPCILAGTSEQGCCSECGAPWERVVEREFRPTQNPDFPKGGNKGLDASNGWGDTPRGNVDTKTLGWQPSCTCNAETQPCTVLDPFAGAGTTGLVARRLGRSFVGIELNPEYLSMAQDRIVDDQPLFNTPTSEEANG